MKKHARKSDAEKYEKMMKNEAKREPKVYKNLQKTRSEK